MLGPLLGVAPMAILGALSLIALRMGDGRTSGLIGLISGVSAAPGLLIAGAPLADDARYPLAVLASVPLWLALGFVASRRATNRVLAGWPDYWRELLWLTAGVILGAAGALIVATALLGESLIV